MVLGLLAGSLGSPWGLLGLIAVPILLALHLIRPDPRRYRLPTLRFLLEREGTSGRSPARERLERNLLLLIQLLVLVLLPLALAAPQVAVPGAAAGETVVVIDASASMAVEDGGETRFGAARTAAVEALGGSNTIVVAGATPRTVLRRADADEAAAAIEDLEATHAPGDLRAAIARASGLVEPPTRFVVVSDFADGSDWRAALERARIAGHDVAVEQVAGGGEANVGIVDLAFGGAEVTATVENLGERIETRRIGFGDGGPSQEVELAPGDAVEVVLGIPPGGGELRLAPGDDFPVDDVVHVAGHERPTIDVLLVTNDEDPYLTTALSVNEEVDLTVAAPPITNPGEHDVVVFDAVDPDRLLQGTVRAARDTVADGGGVIVVAQSDLGSVRYGDLLLVDPGDAGDETGVRATEDHRLTRGFDFLPADGHVVATIEAGTTLAEATETGSPMLAVDDRTDDGGRVVYYGYLPGSSEFRQHYRYPVFWQEAIRYAAGREPIDERHRRTGEVLRYENATTVETPTGAVTSTTVVLERTGLYRTPTGRLGVNLLSSSESAVAADPVPSDLPDGSTDPGTSPASLGPGLALAAALVCCLELWYLRRRGDL